MKKAESDTNALRQKRTQTANKKFKESTVSHLRYLI